MPNEANNVTSMATGSGVTAVTRDPAVTPNTACRIGRKDTGMAMVGPSIGRIATTPGAPRRVGTTTAIRRIAARPGITPDMGHPVAYASFFTATSNATLGVSCAYPPHTPRT